MSLVVLTGVTLVVVVLLCCLLFIARMYYLIRWGQRRPTVRSHPLRVAVVLGSGGHTGEMIGMLSLLGRSWLDHRCVYIVAETDRDSAGAAKVFEASLQRFASVAFVPRAREVGQSYITSVWTTLMAVRGAYRLVEEEAPDVILVNGPGVCVPVVAVALLSQVLRIGSATVPAIAYVESFTCVSHLSLSGKILRRVADKFAVQWPQLQAQGALSSSSADWALVGPFAVPSTSATTKQKEISFKLVKVPSSNASAIVTVGSTKFDSLMRVLSSPDQNVLKALKGLGVTYLLIQKGRSDYDPFTETWRSTIRKELGIEVEVVEYRRSIAELFPRARVIISHAGAGTVLEAMRIGAPTVVVPNTDLMNNHQQELAEELGARNVLICATCDNLGKCLNAGRLAALHQFPEVPSAPFLDLFASLVQ